MGYIAVCGGVNIDIGACSFAALRAKDSNPGTVRESLGGVGRNIAHNLRLLGAEVKLLTALGTDANAEKVERSCVQLGIDLSYALRVPNGVTSTYVFISAPNGDMALAVSDMQICEKLTPDYWEKRISLLCMADAVVLDANLPRSALSYIAAHCNAPIFADPVSVTKAEKLRDILPQIHTLKPNALETELLTGVCVKDEASAREAAQVLLDCGVKQVFLSLGERGVLAAEKGKMLLQPCIEAQSVNMTGAGDAMMAALVWAFVQGRTLEESAAIGTAAAAIAIEGAETINPTMSAATVKRRTAER